MHYTEIALKVFLPQIPYLFVLITAITFLAKYHGAHKKALRYGLIGFSLLLFQFVAHPVYYYLLGWFSPSSPNLSAEAFSASIGRRLLISNFFWSCYSTVSVGCIFLSLKRTLGAESLQSINTQSY